jgi:hypothetical protein
MAASGANRVIPVAPVNPSVAVTSQEAPSPSVIDRVNPALKSPQPNEGEANYTSVPDPIRPTQIREAAPHDWTIHRPAPDKAEAVPAKPIAQVLMDHLKTVWTASASAIQIEQVKNQLTPPLANTPAQAPGELAREVLTYQPTKIKKTENI